MLAAGHGGGRAREGCRSHDCPHLRRACAVVNALEVARPSRPLLDAHGPRPGKYIYLNGHPPSPPSIFLRCASHLTRQRVCSFIDALGDRTSLESLNSPLVPPPAPEPAGHRKSSPITRLGSNFYQQPCPDASYLYCNTPFDDRGQVTRAGPPCSQTVDAGRHRTSGASSLYRGSRDSGAVSAAARTIGP